MIGMKAKIPRGITVSCYPAVEDHNTRLLFKKWVRGKEKIDYYEIESVWLDNWYMK